MEPATGGDGRRRLLLRGLAFAFAFVLTSCIDNFVDVVVVNRCSSDIVVSNWGAVTDPDLEHASALPRHRVAADSIRAAGSVEASPGLPGAQLLVWTGPDTWESVLIVEAGAKLPDPVQVDIPASVCERLG